MPTNPKTPSQEETEDPTPNDDDGKDPIAIEEPIEPGDPDGQTV